MHFSACALYESPFSADCLLSFDACLTKRSEPTGVGLLDGRLARGASGASGAADAAGEAAGANVAAIANAEVSVVTLAALDEQQDGGAAGGGPALPAAGARVMATTPLAVDVQGDGAGDAELAQARQRLTTLDGLVEATRSSLATLLKRQGESPASDLPNIERSINKATARVTDFLAKQAEAQKALRDLEKLRAQELSSKAEKRAATQPYDIVYRFGFPTTAASDSLLSTKGRWCGPCVTIFPSHDPTSPPRVFPKLQPTEQDIADAIHGKAGSFSALTSMSVVSEDGVALVEQSKDRGVRTVQDEVMGSNKPYLQDGVRLVENKLLSQLEQPVVYCKLDNKPDIAWVATADGVQVVVAIQEVKRAFASPVDGLQQVAAYACAAAAGMYNFGVDWKQILVPMSVCTGIAEVHGAAFMATPSFPVAISTSIVLDLRSSRGAGCAHQHRLRAKQQMERSLQLLDAALGRAPPTPSRSSGYESLAGEEATTWFSPCFSTAHLWPKIGGVSNALWPERQKTMLRMRRVFTRLYGSSACRFVCFPVCWANDALPGPATAGNGVSMLVFPNLKQDGYRSGLPRDVMTAKMYISAVNEAMAALHAAGVIHGDMYISNIMWRMSPDRSAVEVKLIDWDTAFLAEDGLPDAMEKAWKSMCKWCLYKTRSPQVDEAVNLRLLDSFMVDTLKHFCSDDKGLSDEWMKAAGDKSAGQLNHAFARMQCLYVVHKGWPAPNVCRTVLNDKAVMPSSYEDAVSVATAAADGAMQPAHDATPPAKKPRTDD